MFSFFFFFKKKTHLSKHPPKTPLGSQLNVSNDLHKHIYRAVEVVCDHRLSCDDALELCPRVFLCDEAPLLPLPSCTNKSICPCRYRHHKDRRLQLRRDMDHGLPDRFIADDRRLHAHDRRHLIS